MPSDQQSLLDRTIGCGVVAVVRLPSSANAVPLAGALARGGVSVVEFTMTMPDALDAIAEVRRELGDEVIVGAGTVLDAETATEALEAGARFVVAPTVNPEVIQVAHQRGALAVPGALSPTEIDLAMRSGADLVKLFPGRVATPGYFRDVLGPFPTARLFPTGNVDLNTAPEYIAAGAVAVGVGKALVAAEAVEAGAWDEIERRARLFRAVVDDARGGHR